LAFNSNNDPTGPPGDDADPPAGPPSAGPSSQADGTAAPAPNTETKPQSTGFVRFTSCRWQQPAEDGREPFCTHREVKPYAGTSGFDADAWCVDCQYYKLRRAPKKRNPDEYRY
jgi:hypothetical protein